jgi:hypothetical protein
MTGRGRAQDPLTLARTAHRLVESDTSRAASLARHALQVARRDGDRPAEVAALHALGFAQHELGDPGAIRTLQAAVRVGARNGLLAQAAMARRPLAIYLAYAGQITSAVREIEAACAQLSGIERARSEVSRIAVFHLAGRVVDTAESDRAVASLRRAGDLNWEARLLKNRGFSLAERGDADAAERDLVRARDLYATLGATTAAIGADYELARIELIRGDLPACLVRLDAIDAPSIPARHRSALELLRAKALVSARLTREARQSLELAQSLWREAGIEDPEGRLDVVALTLLAGDAAAALELALQAQRSFGARGRATYRARAAGLALSAAIATREIQPSVLRNARRAVELLAAAGWSDAARRIQLTIARAEVERGATRAAREALAACGRLPRGAVADRIEAWHVEALMRLSDGDRAGALRAAWHGLRLLDAHRATLGALDLRATASGLGGELAALGLRIALAGSRPDTLLHWAEAVRAGALRLPAVTPVSDPRVRSQLRELRATDARILQAQQSGPPSRSLVARQATLETSIRRLSRHADGTAEVSTDRVDRRAVARALGPTALVELLELDGSLTALTLVDGRLARHGLGEVAAVTEEVDWLRFAVQRLTQPVHSDAQRQTATDGARASATALQRTLLSPLQNTIGDRPIVLVPTGALHAVPWPLLPAMHGRPLSVAPSLSSWLALQAPRLRRRRRIVVVAGPRLRHARAEVIKVADLHRDAVALTGDGATVAAVGRALDGAAIAHLACHGRFRADSPLFSSLELADGQLNAYDLQRLRRSPELVVLSACDLAVSDAQPGDELLGFAAALIAAGTRTIIASVLPAPDAQTKRLMIALHRGMLAGEGSAAALAGAQARLVAGAPALGAFMCLGSG